MSATLRAMNLSKSFGGQTVLDDASLELSAGQLAALMGPSGSGKSTLMAILAGLLPPDRGSVELLGHSIWASSFRNADRDELRRRHCGFIFQQCNLMPALTARQQLEIALDWASDVPRSQIRERAVETLRHLGLGDHLTARPHQLSGGEKQRVAVARAVVKRPDVLFADEPTAALDWSRNGKPVFDLLRQAAHAGGATVLVVTHDHRVSDGCDRVFEVEDGRLKEV